MPSLILIVGLVFGRDIWVFLPSGPFGLTRESGLVSWTTSTGFSKLTSMAIAIDPQQLPWLVVATLLFALAALAMLFFYTYKIQSRSYTVLEKLGRLGKAVKVTSPAPFVRPGTEKESFRSGEPVLKIEGPAVVTVGTESAEFTATLGSERAPDKTKWSVIQATAAIVNPKFGPEVKVIAATAGIFTLAAEFTPVPDVELSSRISPQAAASLTPEARARINPEVVARAAMRSEVQVAAVAPQPNAVELPFIGRGYGSLAMAIILVAAIIILGLAGTLSGEGVATLLGGLLGYVFGVAMSGAGSSAPKKSDGSPS
jgi:hypothetical protein